MRQRVALRRWRTVEANSARVSNLTKPTFTGSAKPSTCLEHYDYCHTAGISVFLGLSVAITAARSTIGSIFTTVFLPIPLCRYSIYTI